MRTSGEVAAMFRLKEFGWEKAPWRQDGNRMTPVNVRSISPTPHPRATCPSPWSFHNPNAGTFEPAAEQQQGNKRGA